MLFKDQRKIQNEAGLYSRSEWVDHLPCLMKLKIFRHWLSVTLVIASVLGGRVAAAPVIATNTQPATATDVVGSQVTFAAAFSGSSPILFQWQVIGGGATNNIPGATNLTLTLANLQL